MISGAFLGASSFLSQKIYKFVKSLGKLCGSRKRTTFFGAPRILAYRNRQCSFRVSALLGLSLEQSCDEAAWLFWTGSGLMARLPW